MVITIIDSKNIDISKWDICIANALHSSIYATSTYLQTIAYNWAAVVCGDYEIVLPFAYKKKFGISYIYQPAFLPTVGFFSSKLISQEVLKSCIDTLFNTYKFVDIVIGYPVKVPTGNNNTVVTQQNNFVLDITNNYSHVYHNYSAHFTKSLRRLKKHPFQYSQEENIELVMALYDNLYSTKANISQHQIATFIKLCKLLQVNNEIVIRKVLFNHEMVAVVLLLKYQHTFYNIISCCTKEGRRLEANYFLYDSLIKEFCGQNLKLDFEGSDLEGVASFYKKMGPTNEPNTFVHHNNLHPLIKLFKK